MRPTFFGFETARRAINISQKGLDITGQNLGNAKTPGYTRQRIDQYSMAMGGANYAYASNSAQFSGQGVNMAGVAQIRDPFLDNQFRSKYEELGELNRISGTLGSLEDSLDEISAADLTTAMKNMEEQLGKLQLDANRPEIANVFMTSAKNISQVLNNLSSKLDKIAQQQKFELDTSIGKVNSILEKLNELNVAIVDEYKNNNFFTGGPIGTTDRMPNSMYGPNELLDDRNRLLDELSGYMNVEIITNPDQSVSVNMGDFKLLDGKANEVHKLSVNPPSGATINAGDQVQIFYDGYTKSGQKIYSTTPQSDVLATGNLTGGEFKGFLTAINGTGVYGDATNNTFNGIGYYKETLDAFAKGFSDALNKANSYSEGKLTVSGTDMTVRSAGDSNAPQYDILFGIGVPPAATWFPPLLLIQLDHTKNYTSEEINKLISSATGPPTEGSEGMNINFSGNISAVDLAGKKLEVKFTNRDFFTSDDGNPISAGNISLTKSFMDNPLTWITNSKTANPGAQDNSNLLAMAKLFDSKLPFGTTKNGVTVYEGKPSEFINGYVLSLGEEKSYYSGLTKTALAVSNQIQGSRDNVSAVSTDEEGINLMTYQKAFSAASRLMTALDEALDMIINRMGRVGL